MCDLVWANTFFSQTFGDIIFFLDIHRCKNFSRLIRHLRYFFCAEIFSPRYFLAKMIFLRNESVGYFFSEITHILPSPPPQKSNGRSLRAFSCVEGEGGGGIA